MVGGKPGNRHTPENIFNEFNDRRAGLLKALTVDVEQLFIQCDPARENLCLFGLQDGTWEVKPPSDEVPPELPEPVVGINSVRDMLPSKNWVALVAAYTDSWLLAVSTFQGATLDKYEKERLFDMMNDLPTLFAVITGKEAVQENVDVDEAGGKIAQSTGEQDSTEQEDTFCASCGGVYTADGFWICCDACDRWFHGKCVRISQVKAQKMKYFWCSSCTKKARV